jgi:hypothetical protein
MMYPYGTLPQHGQHQAQPMQQMTRPSPPQPTWAVPQTHNPYYQMPRSQVMSSREDNRHTLARPDVASSQSPTPNNIAYSNSMHGQGTLSTTDYFPGVIDTSKSCGRFLNAPLVTAIGPWGQKVCEELESFPSLDPDVGDYNHGMMAHDENTPIIDLRQYPGMGQPEHEGLTSFNPNSTRRLSESSFSMSSTGGVLPEVSTYEDIGSSEVVSYPSEYDTWNNTEQTTNQLMSPLASPRRPQHEHIARGGSRSRASPAPHNNVRSSPYTLDSTRFKRWSTGHAPTSTPTNSRSLVQAGDRYAPYGPRYNPHHSMPVYSSPAYNNYGQGTQNVLYSHSHPLQPSNPTLFSNHEQPYHLEVPRPLPSQGLFRLLQSNADRHGGCSSHFADLSDPPDLYSSLHEEPSNPPESDMNPSDPDLVPHEQDLRFKGDLYTPRWVRGHGNKREGWCGLCKPGRWLVLKNSAFWYDKSFTHGVSAATGAAFQGPQDTRRTEGNLDVWEGLCGSCGEWIALVSSKKKGTTWFRHAYKVGSISFPAHSTVWPRRQFALWTRGVVTQSSSMLTIQCSVIHTPKLKTALSDAVKPRLGVFVRHRRRLLPHPTQSSKSLHRTLPLTGIPHLHRSRVARPSRASACRRLRLRFRDRLQRPRLLHKSTPPRRMLVTRRIRHPRPRPRTYTRSARPRKPTSLSTAQRSANPSSACSPPRSRACKVSRATSPVTRRVWRIKSVNPS